MLDVIIIFPLMHLLGIDKKEGSSFERNYWNMTSATRTTTENGRICFCGYWQRAAVCYHFRQGDQHDQETVNRDDFLRRGEFSMAKYNMHQSLLTNLGCKSEFAKLDNRIEYMEGQPQYRHLQYYPKQPIQSC